MKLFVCLLVFLTLQAAPSKCAAGQSNTLEDSSAVLKTLELSEVVVCDQSHSNENTQSANFYKANKLATTEDVLARMMGVSLIKRGAYGLEPVLRAYSAGQINVTINGMRIYGACTDKMDPATIYIEPNNLQTIHATHGASGSKTGASIGGALDMEMKQAAFSHCRKVYTNATSSYSSINNAFNVAAAVNLSFEKVALRVNGTYRKAFNYRAGGGSLVKHSAYEKVNFGTSVAFRLPKQHKIILDYVGDIGWNIGYPSLTMDAGKAIANIASVSHVWVSSNLVVRNIESKVYFNHIYHAMDDTQREDTLMHMDMPGWSYTAGWFSEANLQTSSRNKIKVRADYAGNFSKAEMTMYPEKGQPMFMLTLPDNFRHFAGLYVEDIFEFSKQQSIQLNARVEYMRAALVSDFARKQASIFSADTVVNRVTPTVSASYHALFKKYFISKLLLSYGERSPNAGELFGFYLYNRFDGFDYIGNTKLKNERTLQAEWNIGAVHQYFSISGAVFYNHIYNYIMGATQSSFSAMTEGARGVKQFENMGQAFITGVEGKLQLNDIKGFRSMHTAKYSYAQLTSGEPLPQIAPLKCYHVVRYSVKGWHIQAEAEWALAQKRVNSFSGESTTPAYGLLHLRTGYQLLLQSHLLQLNFAVENVLDTNYREHLDWGNIPRQGRNFIVTLSYAFNQ